MLPVTSIRLKIVKLINPSCHIVNTAQFHTTGCQLRNPSRKKKPAVTDMLKTREERKLWRLGRDLKQAKESDRVLKPVEECELDFDETEIRRRTRQHLQLEPAEEERRALLIKEWNRYCSEVHKREIRALSKMMIQQDKALRHLKEQSAFLYQEAIKPLDNLEQTYNGPTETPPIENYFSPDGAYASANRNWDIDPCPLTEKQRLHLSSNYEYIGNRKREIEAAKN